MARCGAKEARGEKIERMLFSGGCVFPSLLRVTVAFFLFFVGSRGVIGENDSSVYFNLIYFEAQ